MNWDILLQQVLNGLVLGSVYALVALGYTMVYGILQLINFAHGEVLMIGAMVGMTVVTQVLAGSTLPGWVQLLIVAVRCAVPVCVIVSLLMERLAYRPLRNAPQAVAADHGHRPVDRAADAGDDHLDAEPARVPRPAADRADPHRRRHPRAQADADPRRRRHR